MMTTKGDVWVRLMFTIQPRSIIYSTLLRIPQSKLSEIAIKKLMKPYGELNLPLDYPTIS